MSPWLAIPLLSLLKAAVELVEKLLTDEEKEKASDKSEEIVATILKKDKVEDIA